MCAVWRSDCILPDIKIGDFGTALRKGQDVLQPLVGTIGYMSPEVILRRIRFDFARDLVALPAAVDAPPNTAADIFSFGAVGHFVVDKRPPFSKGIKDKLDKLGDVGKVQLIRQELTLTLEKMASSPAWLRHDAATDLSDAVMVCTSLLDTASCKVVFFQCA